MEKKGTQLFSVFQLANRTYIDDTEKSCVPFFSCGSEARSFAQDELIGVVNHLEMIVEGERETINSGIDELHVEDRGRDAIDVGLGGGRGRHAIDVRGVVVLGHDHFAVGDLQDAIGSFDQSGWKDLADFTALSGRNAHQAYLQSEAAAFE